MEELISLAKDTTDYDLITFFDETFVIAKNNGVQLFKLPIPRAQLFTDADVQKLLLAENQNLDTINKAKSFPEFIEQSISNNSAGVPTHYWPALSKYVTRYTNLPASRQENTDEKIIFLISENGIVKNILCSTPFKYAIIEESTWVKMNQEERFEIISIVGTLPLPFQQRFMRWPLALETVKALLGGHTLSL